MKCVVLMFQEIYQLMLHTLGCQIDSLVGVGPNNQVAVGFS